MKRTIATLRAVCVPIEQGEQFFRALQHFAAPPELVIFPRDGQSLRGEPKHASEWTEWFERFLEGKANAARPGGD
jgi:dipeptidyl aminopeptidase/acylaminoacyl peptidase